MAAGDLRLPHVLRASESYAGGSEEPKRAPTGTSDANAMLAALADMSADGPRCSPEPTAKYLAMIQHLLDMRGALITQFAGDTVIVGATSSPGMAHLAGKRFALEASFCQYVRASDAPLVIADALSDPRTSDIAMRRELDSRAYLGVPIHMSDG